MLISVLDLEFLKEWKLNKFSRPPVGKRVKSRVIYLVEDRQDS